MNNVVLIGRLARDPELSYTPNTQTAACRITLAVDKPKKKGEDAGADFIRVTVWGAQAENCHKYLSKGRQAAIRGRITTGSYKDRNGQTVYTTDVVAENVEFIGDRSDNPRSDAKNNVSDNTYHQAPQNEKYGFTQVEEPFPF